MSKGVSYTINAKDKTAQALNSAKGGLDGFKGALGSMKGALVGAFSVVAIKKAADTIGELTDAYGVQQGAEIKLAAAAKNNPVINGEAIKRLKAHASQLQGTSIYGDEQMIEMQAWLTAQKLTEDQIMSVMEASVDLASSGIMPLESAMKNLSKTYAGSAGELGESVPALKALTKEQMASGEAVKIVAEQYKGMGAAVAGGVAGQKQQLANMKGDIKESLGEIFTLIKGDTNSQLLPVFNKINTWLQGNKTQIVNVFKNIPEIAKTAFNLVKSVFSQILTVDFFVQYGGIMWNAFLEIGKTAIGVMFEFLKAIGTIFWEPLKYGFEYVVADFKFLFAKMVNFFVDKLNWILEQYNKVANSGAGNLFGLETTALLDRKEENIPLPENNIKKNIGEAFDRAFVKMKEAGPEIAETLKESLSETMTMGGELFGDEFDVFLSAMETVLNEPITVDPVQLSSPAGGGVSSSSGSSGGGGSIDLSGLMGDGEMGEMGEMLGGFNEALGASASSMGGLVSAAMQLISGLTSVGALLNWGTTIIDGFLTIIAEPLNQILSPLVGILFLVGQTLGGILLPILNLYTPMLRAISEAFLILYNYAIRPLSNGIIFIVTALNNAVANVINSLVKLINKLPGINIRWRMKKLNYNDYKMDELSMDDLQNAGDSYIQNQGGSVGYDGASGGASYSQAHDVYVTFNIDYQVGISAFDDNDVAVKMYDQIERAKNLGLI